MAPVTTKQQTSDLQKEGLVILDLGAGKQVYALKFVETEEERDGYPVVTLGVDATIEVGDVEIGAVEIKNSDTDDRATVDATLKALFTAIERIRDSDGNEAKINDSLEALQVDVKTAVLGYDAGNGRWKFNLENDDSGIKDALDTIEGEVDDIEGYIDGIEDALDNIYADTTALRTLSGYKSYEDTSFVAGESPRDIDINTDLGRNGEDGYLVVDGNGDLLVQISSDGAIFGDSMTIKKGEVLDLSRFNIDTIRLTHSGTDTAYRMVVH